jgi:subtilisin-like proprotein convertase family protein/Ca2+-binding EF-hand superfamily protein
MRIDKLQESARVYHALKNGIADRDVDPEGGATVVPFGPWSDETFVPAFGLPVVKYPYNQNDLDRTAQTLSRYDDNNDGFLDRDEARDGKWSYSDPFDSDLDLDDRLSAMELTQRYARRRLLMSDSEQLRQKRSRVGSEVRPVDRSDAADSKRRGRPDPHGLPAIVMGRFDANRNGRLESEESGDLGYAAGQIDSNRDGDITFDELRNLFGEIEANTAQGDGLPSWFYERDSNGDDQIAMIEYTDDWTDQKVAEFSSLDVNGDGLLTVTEASASRALMGGTFENAIAEILPPRQTVISEIEIEDDVVVGDVNVQFAITHTHLEHLDGYLTGPEGQTIELFTAVGRNDDHFDNTILDDQSRFPIVKARAPFKGTFLPEGAMKRQPSLSSFNGKSAKGIWQLTIRGSRNDRFGMLHRWALMIIPQEDIGDAGVARPTNDGPSATTRSALARRDPRAMQEQKKSQTNAPRVDFSNPNERWPTMEEFRNLDPEMRAKVIERKKAVSKKENPDKKRELKALKGSKDGRDEKAKRKLEKRDI